MNRKAFPNKNPYLMGIVLVTLVAALIGLSIACVRLFAQSTSSAVNAEILRGLQQSVEQAKNNLDYRLQQTADSARTLLGTIYPYLNSDAAIEEQLQEYSEMTRVLNEYIGKYLITRVRLFVIDEKMYSHQNETFFSLALLADDPWFLAILGDRRGGVFWQETSIVPTIDDDSISAISCVAVVSGIKDYDQIVGALYLDINIKDICKIFTSGSTDSAELSLVNENGMIIAHSDIARIHQTNLSQEQMTQINNNVYGTISGDSLVAYDKIDTCGWYIIASANHAILPRPNGMTAGLLFILVTAMLMVLIVIVMIIAYNIILNQTANMINQAVYALESQHSSTAADGKTGQLDAISRLRTSAGKMVFTAQKIVEERYQNRLAISEYQMQSLQAQIKPHFLCNTLDVIKWLITDGDTKNSVWMVNKLSKYLRISINQGPNAVTLAEELELTDNYLSIMQRRFKNAFTLEMDIEPGSEACMIPRFSLQPLVENALLHGLLNAENPDRKLTIRAWPEEDRVLIEIEDNGRGMSEEMRTQLETCDVGSGSGYGVANVRERLKIFVGADTSFRISSQKGVGTCVSINMPARFSAEETDRLLAPPLKI